MKTREDTGTRSKQSVSFFDRPSAKKDVIPVGQGVPIGFEQVYHPEIGLGGAYGAWGDHYDNEALMNWIEEVLGEPLKEDERMNLSPLGFVSRHHTPRLSPDEHLELELEVGARFLREAARASGWEMEEIEGVLIGMSGPVSHDYTEQIARRAGIREDALKVSVHKACDSSVGALHLALNPELEANKQSDVNIAERLFGKKILVGGIEGLSRFIKETRDKDAFQLFANGAGILSMIPGKTMQFLVGKAHEVFDEEGVLAVTMYYPHSRGREGVQSLFEVRKESDNHIRFAGMMHEPEDGSSVVMAGPMGMVKLFVRTGVDVVRDVYESYQNAVADLEVPGKEIAVAIVHHANLKINKLKEKHLKRVGVELSMPWVLNEFGNVSAASNMMAFLRELPSMKPGDHVLIDGFGAGTYYDTLVVALGDALGFSAPLSNSKSS